MAKSGMDKEFVDKLTDIASALAELVTTISEKATAEVDKSGDDKSKDVLSKLNKQHAATVEVVEAMQAQRRDVKKIRNRTDEIYAIVSGIRKQKEDRSMLGNLAQPENKRSLADNVKSIVLIAAGIVALGAAFSLVGDVDFASVIALSISLPLIAHAFAKIGEIKDFNVAKVGMTVLAVVAMAAGLTVASWMLQLTAPISISQALTIVVIAGTMAVAAYGVKQISKAVGNNGLAAVMTAALIMPAMALGIVGAAAILTNTPTVGVAQALTAIGVATAMSAASFGVAVLARSLKGLSMAQTAAAMFAMPVIAAGLVASAAILNGFPSVDVPLGSVITTALAMSVGALALALPIVLFSKMKVSAKDMLVGVLGIVGIMGAMAAGSQLVALGNYSNAPTLSWSAAVGLAILAFTPAVAVLGAIAASGAGALAIGLGLVAVTLLGGAMAATSRLVALGTYKGGPSLAWSSGFALAMLAMVPAVIALGIPGMQLIAALGVASMAIMAAGLVRISKVIKGGDYTGGPSVAWAGGIGMSLMMFGAALASVSPGLISRMFGESTESRLESMVTMAKSLKRIAAVVKGGDYSGGPSAEWSEGVGKALVYFTEAIATLKPNALEMFKGESLTGRIIAMTKMAEALVQIGATVGRGSFTGGPSAAWAEGTGSALRYFAEGVAALAPGVMDRLMGDSLTQRISAMKHMGTAMVEIGAIIATGTFKGGPTPQWANAVGVTMQSMAKAIATMDDEVSVGDMPEWLHVMGRMATRIAFMGASLAGGTYAAFPGKGWYESLTSLIGVVLFAGRRSAEITPGLEALMQMAKAGNSLQALMQSVSATTALGKPIRKAVSDIDMLSRSYMGLSRAMLSVARAVKSFGQGEMPDMSGVTNGLIAMSVLDATKLKDALQAVGDQQGALTELFQLAGANPASQETSGAGGFLSSIFGGSSSSPTMVRQSYELAPPRAAQTQQPPASGVVQPRQSKGREEAPIGGAGTGPVAVINRDADRTLSAIEAGIQKLVELMSDLQLNTGNSSAQHAPMPAFNKSGR